jgi:hypothetical protein
MNAASAGTRVGTSFAMIMNVIDDTSCGGRAKLCES